jgi:hypothetical protein
MTKKRVRVPFFTLITVNVATLDPQPGPADIQDTCPTATNRLSIYLSARSRQKSQITAFVIINFYLLLSF